MPAEPTGTAPTSDDTTPVAAHPLDNPAWHALGSFHRDIADHVPGARRYRTDVSVFSAIERYDDEGWAALARLVGPGGGAVLFGPAVAEPPAGWTTKGRGPAHQMVAGELPEAYASEEGMRAEGMRADGTLADVRLLTVDDVDQMLALTQLAKPGPFLAGTIQTGNYYGVFDGDELVAMAGERTHLPGWTEVSAVCTNPATRGRGLAAQLTAHVVRGVRARGEEAFLHVAVGNDNARRVYERLGFTTRCMVDFALFRAPQPADTPTAPPTAG